MDKFKEELIALQQFLAKLTWQKTIQLILVFFVIASSWIFLVAGDEIIQYFKKETLRVETPIIKPLSKNSVAQINSIVNDSNLIVGVSVAVVELRTNSRHEVYSYSNNPDLQNDFNKFLVFGSEHPFFTENQTQNSRFLRMMNGEVVCGPYTETILSKEMPNSTKYVIEICSTGIPPYYGQLQGVIGLYLKRTPTSEEVDQMRIIVKNLSTTIYQKDLK